MGSLLLWIYRSQMWVFECKEACRCNKKSGLGSWFADWCESGVCVAMEALGIFLLACHGASDEEPSCESSE